MKNARLISPASVDAIGEIGYTDILAGGNGAVFAVNSLVDINIRLAERLLLGAPVNTVIMLRAVGMITLFLSFIEMIRFLTIFLRVSVSIRSSKQVISVGRVPGNALFTRP